MISNNRSISNTKTGTLDNPASFQTQKVMSLGRDNGWGFNVLGKADLPDRPIHLEKWLIIPAQEDRTPVPKRTLERIRAIYAAGLNPKGFVVVHEAPRYLSAPQQENSHETGTRVQYKTEKYDNPTGSTTLTNLVTGFAALLGVMATLVFPVMLLGLVALDPIVIAVMDDGCWVEIDRWNVA
jgi:hypothetical protein